MRPRCCRSTIVPGTDSTITPPACRSRHPSSTRTTRDKGSLEFAGQHIDYGYLPAAHTDGDLYIHFPEQNVLVAGGPVSAERWPVPTDVIAARPLEEHEDELGDPAAFLEGAYRSLLLAYVPD